MSRSPETAIVATCRTPLGLGVETVVRPAPLDPAAMATSASSPTHRRPTCHLRPAPARRPRSATSAVRSGGIPLGIELAARQAAEVSLADLADRSARRRSRRRRSSGRARRRRCVDSTSRSARRRRARGVPAALGARWACRPGARRGGGRRRRRARAAAIVRILARLADRGLVRVDRSECAGATTSTHCCAPRRQSG